ncbi:MAG: hypothetical protein U0R52_01940 [Solirubrobacterales bacterium]
MDKRFLEECLAKGMSLEAIGREVGRHPSTVGYWLEKHGLVASGSHRHSPKRKVDPQRLRVMVAAGASLRELAAEFDSSCSTVRYWLGKLGLETEEMKRRERLRVAKALGLKRTYSRCPRHGHTAFFRRPDGGYRCSRCNTDAVRKRRKKVKRILVDEAGGSCATCGFDRHPAALQFHHLQPAEKRFHLAQGGFTRSLDKARREASKCVLLCANCHAMVEAGVLTTPLGAVK